MPSDTFAAGIGDLLNRLDRHAVAYSLTNGGKVSIHAEAAAAIRRLTPTDTDTAIPAGEVEEAVARIGRLIDEEGGGGGMTRPLSDGKRYMIMTFDQYERDLLTRYERGKAAASPKPDTDHIGDVNEMIAADTDTPVDPGVEGVIGRARAHIAYLRTFDSQDMPPSVEIMEGLVAALAAKPIAGMDAGEVEGSIPPRT